MNGDIYKLNKIYKLLLYIIGKFNLTKISDN